MSRSSMRFPRRFFLLWSSLLLIHAPIRAPLAAQEGETLTFQELMKVRRIRQQSISADGNWVAVAAAPDRGDGEVQVYASDSEITFSIPTASDPVISHDGKWVAATLGPSFEARETARRNDSPRSGLALLALPTGEIREWAEVQEFSFSADGAWLARLHHPPKGQEGDLSAGEESPGGERARTRGTPGSTLVLLDLPSGEEVVISHVKSFSFHPGMPLLAYVVAAPDGEGDGVYLRRTDGREEGIPLETGTFLQIRTTAWWEEGPRLAWVSAREAEDGEAGPGTLSFWDEGETTTPSLGEGLREGWELPVRNRLHWTKDGERLFYGTRPGEGGSEAEAEEEGEGAEEKPFDPYDFAFILEGRTLDVWHTDDPYINSNQKRLWSRLQNRTFTGVYHFESGRAVQLEDEDLELEGYPENPYRALATSEASYRKESTWTAGAEDVYTVDLRTGERTLVVRRHQGGESAANDWIDLRVSDLAMSPGGRFVAWFKEDHWHLHDAETQTTRNLTEGMEVAFYDVDHDYPNPRGGHGIGGWLEGDEALLIHGKWDVFQFPTGEGSPVNLTRGEGQRRETVFRVQRIDPELQAFSRNGTIHLASFDWQDKSFGFFSTRAGRGGLEPLVDEEKRFRFVARAEEADRILFTREDYDEFPDLWVADLDLGNRRKVTEVNPGLLDRFAWGTPRLVEWTSDDGIPLHGVAILPGDFEEGKRYPVLTYFYRFYSQRLHEFNEPVINHRPSFPIYASDGYIVFLPDVRFEVGRPGFSALKSVVPGVKKLVDLGWADPDALGLHGHSWGGYTTAFVVTQTNIFAAAVAGAPVGNMTSAYGGIRWESGIARQHQYEMGQSRLSGSIFEARSDYIENSPIFYANKVETPLLLMHGDEDGAVPWYQSIELYLALRRAGKEAVFLQYGGEPHHPQEYPNKLDYSLKMKEFFDHHLKGAPAPEWWAVGVPHGGR